MTVCVSSQAYQPLYGVKLFGSRFWPQKLIGHEELRIKGHPLTYWVARQLARLGVAIEPDVIMRQPVFADEDPIYVSDHLGGPAIFGSHKQIDALIRTASSRPPAAAQRAVWSLAS